MTFEIKTLNIVAFRDAEGNPTCAGNFETGKVCPFYRTQRLGCNETCAFANDHDGKHTQTMKRRGDGTGTLIPLATCPLWRREILGCLSYGDTTEYLP